MKKIQYYLAIIALAATLSGLPLQGLGTMANAVSSRQVSSASSSFVAGKVTKSLAFKPYGPCLAGGGYDC